MTTNIHVFALALILACSSHAQQQPGGVSTLPPSSAGGGSGAVGSCGQAGALAYYLLTGTAVTCDSNLTIDGSGNVVNTAGFKSGSGAGKTGYTLWSGATSGGQAIAVADVAGASVALLLPTVVGVAGQVLQDTGAVTCPTLPAGGPATCHQMSWAAASGGCMTPVTQTVTSASVITFSSIPATCNTLIFYFSLATAGGAIHGKFNSDAGSNYDFIEIYSGTNSSSNPAGFTTAQNDALLAFAGTQEGHGTIWLYNYASATAVKGYESVSGRRDAFNVGYSATLSGDWLGASGFGGGAATVSNVSIYPASGTFTGYITMKGE